MKFTVLGVAGRMGRMHARHLIDMGHKVYGVDTQHPTGAGWDAMEIEWCCGVADDCDGIVIATPAHEHLTGLETAVSQGKHVFIEKPICLIGETKLTRDNLNRADKKGLIVSVGYNLRFHPAVMQAKEMIASGNFPPLWGSFLLRQKPQRPLAHFLEEWASHEIDLAMHLLGDVTGRAEGVLLHDNMTTILGHSIGGLSFTTVDLTDPSYRAFTLVDHTGKSFTRDIELQHVQPEHYKNELAAWVDEVDLCRPLGERNRQLATGWDGLAVIELLERLNG